MVNNLVFSWPKPLFFMVLGAHGIYIYTEEVHVDQTLPFGRIGSS